MSDDSDNERSSGTRGYNNKLKKDYEKILENKERKRLIDLKREITKKPKRPKLLSLEVV